MEQAKSGANPGANPPVTTDAAKPADQAKGLTPAAAAKRVRRPVAEWVDGKDEAGNPVKLPRIKHVAVAADEVLAFKDHGTHVVVVTKDGQKFSSEDVPAGASGTQGKGE